MKDIFFLKKRSVDARERAEMTNVVIRFVLTVNRVSRVIT